MTKKVDKIILIVTILLVIFGLFMVYSASNVVASYKYNDSFYFIKRQGLFACIGFIIMYFTSDNNIEKKREERITSFVSTDINCSARRSIAKQR